MMTFNLPKAGPKLGGPFNRRGTKNREPKEFGSRSIPACNSQGNLGQIPFSASSVG